MMPSRFLTQLSVVAVTLLWMASPAQAQRNFSRRQQASIYAYEAQLQAQERNRQQLQLRQIQQQFVRQQSQLQAQQNRTNALVDQLDSVDPQLATNYRLAPTSRGQMFGTAHYNSPYYMRTGPYFDYQFIRTRNRQFIQLSNQ